MNFTYSTIKPTIPRDILWFVFNMNAEDEQIGMDERLRTTLRSTHVCQGWRTLILKSPSIWGKLLYLDCLHGGVNGTVYPHNLEMMYEVLRRSVQAPLWIQATGGRVGYGGRQDRAVQSHAFLIQILSHHWDRIERLTLYQYGKQIHDPEDHDLRSILSCLNGAAPSLRECHIENVSKRSAYQRRNPDYSSPLFSNSAPSLRYLCSDYLTISVHASWLPSLTTLITTPVTSGFSSTVRSTLKVLSQIPNLIYLELGHAMDSLQSINDVENCPTANLPRLEYMGIKTSARNALAFVEKTKRSGTGCIVNIKATFDIRDVCDPSFEHVALTLYNESFAKNIRTKYSTGLEFAFMGFSVGGITLTDKDCLVDGIYMDLDPEMNSNGLYLSLLWPTNGSDWSPIVPPGVVDSILKFSIFHEYTNITVLRLTSDLDQDVVQGIRTTGLGTTYPIDTLECDSFNSFGILTQSKDLQSSSLTSRLFTRVKNLSVDVSEHDDSNSSFCIQGLQRVTKLRNKMGINIESLNIYGCRMGVDYIETFSETLGLRQLWMRWDIGGGEYKDTVHVYSR